MTSAPPDTTGRRVGAAALAVVVLLLIGYPLFRTFESQGSTSPVTASSIDALGETLYLQTCAACHGSGGQPGPYAALTTRDYLESVTDAWLTSRITEGVPGTAMAAFGASAGGDLSVIQVQAVVTYLRSLYE